MSTYRDLDLEDVWEFSWVPLAELYLHAWEHTHSYLEGFDWNFDFDSDTCWLSVRV